MQYVLLKVGGEWSSTGGKAGGSTPPLTGSFASVIFKFSASQLKNLHCIPKPPMADLTVTYYYNDCCGQTIIMFFKMWE
jgi:hypothetical protein